MSRANTWLRMRSLLRLPPLPASSPSLSLSLRASPHSFLPPLLPPSAPSPPSHAATLAFSSLPYQSSLPFPPSSSLPLLPFPLPPPSPPAPTGSPLSRSFLPLSAPLLSFFLHPPRPSPSSSASLMPSPPPLSHHALSTRSPHHSAIVLFTWVRNVIGYDSHTNPPSWMDTDGQYRGEIGLELLRVVAQANRAASPLPSDLPSTLSVSASAIAQLTTHRTPTAPTNSQANRASSSPLPSAHLYKGHRPTISVHPKPHF